MNWMRGRSCDLWVRRFLLLEIPCISTPACMFERRKGLDVQTNRMSWTRMSSWFIDTMRLIALDPR